MELFLLSGAALVLPVALARYLAASRRRRHLDQLRLHDPQLASQIEQAAHTRNPAGLPMHDRYFDKPRRHNHF